MATTANRAPDRIFLVVVDDSPELEVALRYACRRARRTGGRVALLTVMEPSDYQHFMAVSDIMQEEARAAAEQVLQKWAEKVNEWTGALPVLYLREGARGDELLKLIEEEPTISILVLGANPGPKGPGPLVSMLTGRMVGKLRVPITIVPGNLSPEDVEKVS